MAIDADKVCGNPLAQRLLFLFTSGSTKTARDKNKKSGNTPPQTSKQATNEPRRKRGFFLVVPDCNPARALCVQACKGRMARGNANEIRHANHCRFRLVCRLGR